MSSVIVTGTLEKITSLKDKTIRTIIDLNELGPDQMQRLFSFIDVFVKVLITDENISQDEIEIIEGQSLDNEAKSPSQRLRNVLYRYWEQRAEGYDDFNLYYHFKMNQIIEHYKSKLT